MMRLKLRLCWEEVKTEVRTEVEEMGRQKYILGWEVV